MGVSKTTILETFGRICFIIIVIIISVIFRCASVIMTAVC